jgi:hypothetical protein
MYRPGVFADQHVAMMQTYWLVFQHNKETEVFIQPGYSLLDAKMKASIAGQKGELKESHALDAKTAKKVPATAIGRTLTPFTGQKASGSHVNALPHAPVMKPIKPTMIRQAPTAIQINAASS